MAIPGAASSIRKAELRSFTEWNRAFARYKRYLIYGLNNDGNTVASLPEGEPDAVYTLNQSTHKLKVVYKFGPSHKGFDYGLGINDAGDVVGVSSGELGNHGWAVVSGALYQVACNEYNTTATAINNYLVIVGTIPGRFTNDGFVLKHILTKPSCETLDDPNGVGTTSINGVNDKGDLVGTYVDSNGNTHGFLATPP